MVTCDNLLKMYKSFKRENLQLEPDTIPMEQELVIN